MASHTLSVLPIVSSSSTSQSSKKPDDKTVSFRSNCLVNSFHGSKLSLQEPSIYSLNSAKRRSFTVSVVSSSLPTTNVVEVSGEKAPKWSARAIKSFAMGELEARKLKYPNTGTEALLMGILVEGTSIAAKSLRESGVTLLKVRDEIVRLLGRSDMYFFSPEHPPLTEPAQRALNWALSEKLKSGGDGEITSAYLLLGIWSEKGSAGHTIMETLGFNDEKAKELSKSMDKDIYLSYK